MHITWKLWPTQCKYTATAKRDVTPVDANASSMVSVAQLLVMMRITTAETCPYYQQDLRKAIG